jgi:hypothetical protein
MQAVDEDIDLKQMRDIAAAKKRWDGLGRKSEASYTKRSRLCYFSFKQTSP